MLKMLRIQRLSSDFIPDDVLIEAIKWFYKSESQDVKIAKERFMNNLIQIIKQIMTTLVITYFLALLWYRFSDYWQTFLGFGDDETNYFVVVYKLRPQTYDIDVGSAFALNTT